MSAVIVVIRKEIKSNTMTLMYKQLNKHNITKCNIKHFFDTFIYATHDHHKTFQSIYFIN